MQLVEREKDSMANTLDQAEYEFRLAQAEDACVIASTYENVFGKDGVMAPGHEAYPEPDVFSASGVLRIINNPSRHLVVAQLHNKIVGGMIINYLSPFNCEFSCVCVDPQYQGFGISPLMLAYARQLADQSSLTINNTEIVTHSVLSQTAHNRAGYNKVTGFGFCQYPCVFFANHPESCLWISEIQGRVGDALRASRPGSIGTGSIRTGSISTTKVADLNEEELSLFDALSEPRRVFVPETYRQIAHEILSQFTDVFDYRVHTLSLENNLSNGLKQTEVDLADEAPYAYLKFPGNIYSNWRQDIDEKMAAIKSQGKRFIQAKIPANGSSAIAYAEYLQSKDFILLGLLPACQVHHDHGNYRFDDLLVLQWIKPDIVVANALPGETNSVIKLYGHPENLSGRLLKVMRYELRRQRNENHIALKINR